MSVRHCGDSFEALVAQARLRNLGISAGIFLLLLGSLAALLRFTRQAKKLAGMQMSFAAGVSHELRTPLTVISTAAYNLQGRIGNNPAQVERYGAFIQQQEIKLTNRIQPGLPLILGDALALKHAIQNMLSNAVKDGAEGGAWIGVSASVVQEQSGPIVEIRVADDGPGIRLQSQKCD
jgi:signal transduction histidine kinase